MAVLELASFISECRRSIIGVCVKVSFCSLVFQHLLLRGNTCSVERQQFVMVRVAEEERLRQMQTIIEMHGTILRVTVDAPWPDFTCRVYTRHRNGQALACSL